MQSRRNKPATKKYFETIIPLQSQCHIPHSEGSGTIADLKSKST